MIPTSEEVRRELERLWGEGILAPQERALLRLIVRQTMDGDTSRLYQKALADDLAIHNVKQIGVLATRIRTKLDNHYALLEATRPPVQILLSKRGYEARISYSYLRDTLSESAMLLVADARAALDQRSLPGIDAARVYVERALQHGPDDPLLLALKAQCLATRALYGVNAADDLRAAEAIVDAIGPGADRPWEYWFAAASVRMALHWDWAGAEDAFQKAMLLSRGEARFSAWHTALLAATGRADAAVEHLRVAVSRSPDSPIIRADLAINQIYANRLDEAEETITGALSLFGSRAHYLLHVHLAILHEARGDHARASEAIHRVPLRWPKTAITLGLRALFSGLAGQHQRAQWHLRKLIAMRRVAGHRVPAIQLAVAFLGAGDADAAVEWLHLASVIERDPNAVLNNVYPFFRHLHGHAGFRELITGTMKLPLPE